ncbi:DUF4189 domain-containing protein [Pseudoxanthomonas wuyuanensis]|nr:DUF4189 domain-containing protein [Pseudoxanthomonas wuyuanensis]
MWLEGTLRRKGARKMRSIGLFASGLLFVSGSIYAQNCGGMPAVNGVCIPPDSSTSPLHSTYGQQQSSPQEVWIDRWGAIAADGPSGILGATTGMGSKRKAEKAALAECRSKGGGACKIDMAYRNQCVALVTGDSVYFVRAAVTIAEASHLGVSSCVEEDTNCRVYYSACSLAERIR